MLNLHIFHFNFLHFYLKVFKILSIIFFDVILHRFLLIGVTNAFFLTFNYLILIIFNIFAIFLILLLLFLIFRLRHLLNLPQFFIFLILLFASKPNLLCLFLLLIAFFIILILFRFFIFKNFITKYIPLFIHQVLCKKAFLITYKIKEKKKENCNIYIRNIQAYKKLYNRNI
jgi:hypothetical protein